MTTKTTEIFERITGRIVEIIERGEAGNWEKPWTSILASTGLHHNATTGKAYLGMNQLTLMAVAADLGYSVPVWATYRQFKALGGQVRKGERGVELVKWGRTYTCLDCDARGRVPCAEDGHTPDVHMWASTFHVFNVAQQDGYEPAGLEVLSEPERHAAADRFIEATGATIHYAPQDRAYYDRSRDEIVLPLREQFQTAQGFYGTAFHELTHWTGAPHRLGRAKGSVFGDSKYAAEELVAELGSTFLAARFGIEADPHPEHVAYLASWLRALKADPRALYRAARDAQAAAEFLLGVAGVSLAAETGTDVEVAA